MDTGCLTEYLGDIGGYSLDGFERTVIIPAYNEEHRIGPTLDEYLRHFGSETEIIVVLNGCRDHTAGVVSSFLDANPTLRMIDEPGVVGKGGAVTLGFKRAKGEIVAYVDADGATSAVELERLMNQIGDEDGVIGSRWIDKSTVCHKQTILRRLTSRVFNAIVRILFRLPYKDTQCGAKVFRRAAVNAIADKLGTTNMTFDVDVLYLMEKEGYVLKEIPTFWEDKPDSTVRMWRVAPRMLGALVRLRIMHSRFRSVLYWHVGVPEPDPSVKHWLVKPSL